MLKYRMRYFFYEKLTFFLSCCPFPLSLSLIPSTRLNKPSKTLEISQRYLVIIVNTYIIDIELGFDQDETFVSHKNLV